MRFLKRKIQAANETATETTDDYIPEEVPIKKAHAVTKDTQNKKRKKRKIRFSRKNTENRAVKNIFKNFGQAICKFILSEISLKYMEGL
mmetsp:Transcript_13561/g.11627  ORF Transcript_13561/g.11627 Transcript_13561/m.11627 type:complete len:89 (-) Transcript_13561:620-886(-)